MGLLDSLFNTQAPDYSSGLLGDTADLQRRANTTGLVNMALGYLAAPKNQNLGLGRILAGSYVAGQQGAQGTYDNALNDWQTKQKLLDMQSARAKQTGLDAAMASYGQPNSNLTAPDTVQNVPAPQSTDAPNFGTVQQTVQGVATPTFDQSKWMKTVLPNLDAKDALAYMTKADKNTWIDGGDAMYQANENGQLTGQKMAKGLAPAFHTLDLGNRTVATDGTNMLGSFDKSASPDSILSNNRIVQEGALNRGVQIRGQNLTNQRSIDAANGGDALNSGISAPAIEAAAARYRMDGTIPPMGMGKAAVAIRTQILNRAAAMDAADGVSGIDARTSQVSNKSAASSLTQLSKQKTMVSAFEKNAQLNGDMALKLSDQVDRTGVPIFNQWIQSGQKNVTGNPAVSQFHAANETYINEYAKIMSGSMGNTPVSDSARAHAHSLLSTAQTKDQYKAVMSTLSQEMNNRMKGMNDEEAILKQSMSPKGSQPDSNVKTYNPKTGRIE